MYLSLQNVKFRRKPSWNLLIECEHEGQKSQSWCKAPLSSSGKYANWDEWILEVSWGRIHFFATIFSRPLDKTGNKEIGRKLEESHAGKFLGSCVTLATLKQRGTLLVFRDQLKRKVIAGERICAKSRNSLVGIPSGPGDLFLSLLSKSKTILFAIPPQISNA